MAEVAAGAGIALAVEEVLSTTAQAGVAGYFLTKPTLPLKATFTRVAVSNDDDLHRRSLARSNHTLTILKNKAYIFGGTTKDGLASSDIHVINLAPEKNEDPDYQLIPAIPSVDGGPVPKSREKHAACAFGDQLAVYGGVNTDGHSVDEEAIIWLLNPAEKTWSALRSGTDADGKTLQSSEGSKLFANGDELVLYTTASTPLWRFNPKTTTWTALPTPPTLASPTNAALTDNHIYLITSTDPLSSQLHILPLHSSTPGGKDELESEGQKWTTLTFPTNPLAPGPLARHAGALLPITTGYGRNYLTYLLGARDKPTSSALNTSTTTPNMSEQDITECSDTWILQLPSSSLQPKPAWSISEAIKPAKIKDAIRHSVGAENGKWEWAEVDVKVPDNLGAGGSDEGKLHPGPRAWFGADVMGAGDGVVFWGGEDAEGERCGDGWVVRFE